LQQWGVAQLAEVFVEGGEQIVVGVVAGTGNEQALIRERLNPEAGSRERIGNLLARRRAVRFQ
jgi:hypothetical protein